LEIVPSNAEQLAVVPPFDPAQLHVHGPVPATDDAVLAVQRFVVGAEATVVPFALPQVPFTATASPLMVTVAVLVPRVAPLGDDSVTLKVLLPVKGVALLTVTLKVLLAVLLAVQLSVPLLAV
jgi:hypothetical protein